MGLLDQPLISEMDDLEQAAAKGDEEAFGLVLMTLAPEKRMYVNRLIQKYGLSQGEALKKANVIASIYRSSKPFRAKTFSHNA